MLRSLRPPRAISPESPNHCGDTAGGTPTPPQRAESGGLEHPSGAGMARAQPGARDRRSPDTCYNKYSAQTPFHMYDPVG